MGFPLLGRVTTVFMELVLEGGIAEVSTVVVLLAPVHIKQLLSRTTRKQEPMLALITICSSSTQKTFGSHKGFQVMSQAGLPGWALRAPRRAGSAPCCCSCC